MNINNLGEINNNVINELVSTSSNYGTELYIIEGCLSDNYIFYDINEWDGSDERKHLVILTNHQNEWTSYFSHFITNSTAEIDEIILDLERVQT